VLASKSLLDLNNIDFVQLVSDENSSMWLGLNIPLLSGTTLVSQIGQVDLMGLPFVVEADGERIYLGAFNRNASSYSIRGPEVIVEHIQKDGFPITLITNMIPPPSDMRNDPRILKVLSEAGKSIP
jgi:hypothetical protein